MRQTIIKWWYRRRFRTAYMILRKLSDRHRDAGHEVYFRAFNETDVHLSCVNCPELQPLRRKRGAVIHITRSSDGGQYRR